MSILSEAARAIQPPLDRVPIGGLRTAPEQRRVPHVLRHAWPYVALVLLGVALYVPFRAQTLYFDDSVGYAQAIHRFDLAAHIPPIPGYPLYVLSLRLVHALTGLGDNATIVLCSSVFTVLAGLLCYRFAHLRLSRGYSFAVAVLLMTSPLVWFDAEIALSYSSGLLAGLAAAYCLYRVRRGETAYFYAAPVVWGVAAGFRPYIAPMLLPLAVYCYAPAVRLAWQRAIVPVVLAALSGALWLVPLVAISGGMRMYLGLLRTKSGSSGFLTSFLAGHPAAALTFAGENLAAVAAYLALSAVGVLPVVLIGRSHQRGSTLATDWTICLAFWLAGGVAFDAVTKMAQAGYALPYLPALLLLGASVGVGRAARPSRAVLAALAVGIIAQSCLFLGLPQLSGPVSSNWLKGQLLGNILLQPTRSRIALNDALTADLTRAVAARYPATQTLLVVPIGNGRPEPPALRPMFAQGQYYLPAWQQRLLYIETRATLDPKGGGGYGVATVSGGTITIAHSTTVTVPENVRWLVWYCNVDQQFYPFPSSWRRITLAPGVDLVAAPVPAGKADLHWGPFEFRHQ